jgi:hypothetical protein
MPYRGGLIRRELIRFLKRFVGREMFGHLHLSSEAV